MQERYDKNIAEYDKLDILANNIEVSDNDRHIKNEAIENIRTKLKSIRDSGRWEDARGLIRQASNEFQKNEFLKTASSNYQEEKKAQEEIARIKTEHGRAYVFNDPNKFKTEAIKDDQGNIVGYTKFQKDHSIVPDYDARMETYFDDMVANASESGLEQNDLREYLLNSSTYTGISERRIEGYLNDAVDRFLGSNEGAIYTRAKKELENIRPTKDHLETAHNELGKVATYAEIEERAQELAIRDLAKMELKAVGKEKVFGRYGQNYRGNPEYSLRAGQREQNIKAGRYYTNKGPGYTVSVDDVRNFAKNLHTINKEIELAQNALQKATDENKSSNWHLIL